MNQRIWINIFLLVVIISLSTTIFFKKDKINDEFIILSNIDPNNIEKIEIQRKALDTLSFNKKEGEWYIDLPFKFRANPNRIESILNLLTTKSYKKLKLDEVDIAQFDLRDPRVILTLNNYEFSFGTTNPIDQKRYILFGQEIYLTNDFLFPQLMVSFEFFLETKLLPDNINITSIKFPQYEIQKNDNKWVSTKTDHSEEKIKDLVSKWEKATSLSISKYEKKDSKGIVSVQTYSGKKINFSIIETEPYLILAREDIGIQYNMGIDNIYNVF